jgi:hypothetical protein
MSFTLRLGISLLCCFVFFYPVVDFHERHGYMTFFLFTSFGTSAFLTYISIYSSPTVRVATDTKGAPIAVFAHKAKQRKNIGGFLVALSLTLTVVYLSAGRLLSADQLLAFNSQFDVPVEGPALIALLFGQYLYLTNMCSYCMKLNLTREFFCAKCGNELQEHFLQPRRN